MSLELPIQVAKEFNSMVKLAYQAGKSRKLSPTIRVNRNRGVKTFQFPTMGKGIAQLRTNQAKRKLMNTTHGFATATGVQWEAADFTDIFSAAEVPINEIQNLAILVTRAINRREDQTIIDAMEVSGTTQIVASSVGGTDTSLNIEKLIETGLKLDENNVDEDERHFAGDVNAKAGLLGETQVTSSDFATVKALVNGSINSFMGFDFHWFGKMDEGGIPKTGSERSNFAYAGGIMSALGLGVIMDEQVKTTFENLFGSWLTVKDFTAGAVAIDNEGIVEVLTFE